MALLAVNAVQTPCGSLSTGDVAGTQSLVLRVIVENLFYPVTLEVLHQVPAHLTIPVPGKLELLMQLISAHVLHVFILLSVELVL